MPEQINPLSPLRGERIRKREGSLNLRPRPSFNPLTWCAALVISALLSMSLGIIPGITAGEGASMELTVEQAKELAYENNTDLQLARLALEQGELALEALDQSITELERQRDDLASLKEALEEERERLQREIEELENSEDPDQDELERLRRQKQAVEFSITMADQALEGAGRALDELNEQYRQAEAAYREGENMLEMQEEMLGFKVESLFAGALIVLEQQPLQQSALVQLAQLVAAEREKQKAGYSTPLQVEEAASKMREMEAVGDGLDRKLVALLDELCLTCGLTPGAALTLVPFTPVEPRPVDLDQATAEALSGGWMVQARREALAEAEAERERIREQYGEDSLRYRSADLAVRRAALQLRQAEGETRAAVRRTYFALIEKERQIGRCEADLNLGRLQKSALEAGYRAGHSSAAEAAAGPLALQRKEADLVAARYYYHIAYLEFDLARRGYYTTGTGLTNTSGGLSTGPPAAAD